MLSKIIEILKEKRILILGFGREGKSSLKFIQTYLPDNKPDIADYNPETVESLIPAQRESINFYCGENYLNVIHNYDIVIKSPGISLLGFDLSKTIISSQTDLFFNAFASQTIGITGTKGKSTTTSLIYHLLKSSNFDCVLAGNIGIPCFDVIPEITNKTWIVFELSANQLQNCNHSPHIAILLNIFEEHLDHFGTFLKYKEAKNTICKYQKKDDIFICHREFLPLNMNYPELLLQFPLGLLNESAENLPLKGSHNRLNMEAALLAVHAAGVNMEKAIQDLVTFNGLPHRLEKIGIFGGVTFYNDSIATIPEATIAAIDTLEHVDFLLLGGFDRGIDYTILIEYLIDYQIKHILFTGKAGIRMMKMLLKYTTESKLLTYDTMQDAFTIVQKFAQPKDICLLSPAAASYDIYKNFEHRGDIFRELAINFVNDSDLHG